MDKLETGTAGAVFATFPTTGQQPMVLLATVIAVDRKGAEQKAAQINHRLPPAAHSTTNIRVCSNRGESSHYTNGRPHNTVAGDSLGKDEPHTFHGRNKGTHARPRQIWQLTSILKTSLPTSAHYDLTWKPQGTFPADVRCSAIISISIATTAVLHCF